LSVPAIRTHCRRKVDTLLLPGNHAENVITVGVHGTTAIMFIVHILYRNLLNKSMNSNVPMPILVYANPQKLTLSKINETMVT